MTEPNQHIIDSQNLWWAQDAERHEEIGRAAREAGTVIPGCGRIPKLNDDGSLADPSGDSDEIRTFEQAVGQASAEPEQVDDDLGGNSRARN